MDYSDTEEAYRRKSRKMAYLGESSRRHYESLSGHPYALMGDMSFLHEEDISLEATQARSCCDAAKASPVLERDKCPQRHSDLAERLSRYADKTIYERLQKEFEAARAMQTQEIELDGEQWNDGLLATIRERVICCFEGARIGIMYETSYAGEPCDVYHCVLESKSFLEKMTVLEHAILYFLPIREAENNLLSSNAMKFIDYIGELLQAYVDRREQVRLAKELYGNQIKEIYFTLPYNFIAFSLFDFDCEIQAERRRDHRKNICNEI